MSERLVLSVSEAAKALGISDDLVYELLERRELPFLRFGRRKVIPRRAIELIIEAVMDEFDPRLVLTRLPVHTKRLSAPQRRSPISNPSPASSSVSG